MLAALRCILSCLHQEESLNSCDERGLGPAFTTISLQNRSSVVALLSTVKADCAYCLLDTIEHVCGAGCLGQKLHFLSDPVLPRPCAPTFAATLALAQAKAVQEA